jgi:hypothetical protein
MALFRSPAPHVRDIVSKIPSQVPAASSQRNLLAAHSISLTSYRVSGGFASFNQPEHLVHVAFFTQAPLFQAALQLHTLRLELCPRRNKLTILQEYFHPRYFSFLRRMRMSPVTLWRPFRMRLLLHTFRTFSEYNIMMTGPGSQPTSLARDGSSPSYPGAGGGFLLYMLS